MRHPGPVAALLLSAMTILPVGAGATPTTLRRHPLSESELVYLLQAGVSPVRTLSLVQQLGVAFHPSQASIDMLRSAGASESLVQAVLDHYRDPSSLPDPTPVATPALAAADSTPSEPSRPSDPSFAFLPEAPRGPIEIARAEVTNGEYDAFVRAMGMKRPSTPFWGTPNNYPVVNVTWHEAVSYCRWLTLTTGIRHRLPYEIEWEYAARGGLTLKTYPWGDSPPTDRACFARSAPCRVRSYRPNGYGLYDMAGSVYEWCQDKYDERGKTRVIKGGSWAIPAGSPLSLSLSRKDRANPKRGKNDIGFRVVREP